MKKIYYALISIQLLSCGGGITNTEILLSSGYSFVRQGEGYNIIMGGPKEMKALQWIKKYHEDGNYIAAWQADTIQFNSPTFNSGNYVRNTFYPGDRFYIIDIKQSKLLGPYKLEDFFADVRKRKMEIQWKD